MKCSFLILIAFVVSISLFAQSSKRVNIKNGSSYVHFLQRTSQRIVPGRREVPPHTEYRFILVWKSTQTPQSIFWNSDTGSMICNVFKLHKNNNSINTNNDITGNGGYDKLIVNPTAIKKGDTIEIWPLKSYNSFPAAAQKIKKSLVIKTKKNGWLYIPTKNIIQKPPMNMP
ncbi:MAG TPA: hypothetical protein VN721_03920 [Flavipsychrobacter sp.]|nr:hypothetical protein [Flavipsychrobacter sp.]